MKLDIKKQTSNTKITQAYHSRCSSWKLSSNTRITWEFWILLNTHQARCKTKMMPSKIRFPTWQATHFSTKKPINQLAITSEKQRTPFYIDLDPCESTIILTCLSWTYCWSKFKRSLDPGGCSLKWPIRRGSTRKGYHFQASSIWEGWNYTSWSIWKGRENCHFVWSKAQKGPTDALHGFEKSWVNRLDSAFTAVKRDAK